MSIRFEISINGVVQSVCGLDASGVLTTSVTWVGGADDTGPGAGKAGVIAGGLDNTDKENRRQLRWLQCPLKEGDVVTIRVLSLGPYDEPKAIQISQGKRVKVSD